MVRIICGIDEAGRGAVLGPMVLAGVSVPESDMHKLTKLGVRDSKELTPGKREKLAERIEKTVKDIVIVKVAPCKIDSYSKEGVNLNRLEAMKMSIIVDCLNADCSYIDGPEKNLNRFRAVVSKMLKTPTELVVENFADKTYPVVSAASIIAKVERDREVEELRRKYGLEGTGYPSDERTIAWMKNYLKENKKFPEKGLVRHSWITTKGMLGNHQQRRLFGFLRR